MTNKVTPLQISVTDATKKWLQEHLPHMHDYHGLSMSAMLKLTAIAAVLEWRLYDMDPAQAREFLRQKIGSHPDELTEGIEQYKH